MDTLVITGAFSLVSDCLPRVRLFFEERQRESEAKMYAKKYSRTVEISHALDEYKVTLMKLC
jgi:hypothetical protein